MTKAGFRVLGYRALGSSLGLLWGFGFRVEEGGRGSGHRSDFLGVRVQSTREVFFRTVLVGVRDSGGWAGGVWVGTSVDSTKDAPVWSRDSRLLPQSPSPARS